MSKLVKARYKSVEHLPEDFKCCAAMLASIISKDALTVDLADQSIPDSEHMLRCKYCGYEFDQPLGVRNIDSGKFVPLQTLDLDEGEYANETR